MSWLVKKYEGNEEAAIVEAARKMKKEAQAISMLDIEGWANAVWDGKIRPDDVPFVIRNRVKAFVETRIAGVAKGALYGRY